VTSAQGQAHEDAIASRPAYINVPTPFGGHPWPGQPASELADPSYEAVPQELYDYVEHLKRVWPHRRWFSISASAPEELRAKNPAGWLDSVDQGLSYRMHDEMVGRRHIIIAINAPVWRPNRTLGPFLCERLVTGWSVPAPDGMKFG
jgi:hypothetical protein